MTVLRNGLERWSAGAAVTTGGSGAGDSFTDATVTAGATLLASAAAAAHGAVGVACYSPSGGVARVGWTFSSVPENFSAVAISAIFRVYSAPGVDQRIINTYLTTGATTAPYALITAAGKIRVNNAGHSASWATYLGASAAAIDIPLDGTPIEVQLYFVDGTTTTDGYLAARVIRRDTDAVLWDGASAATNTGTVGYWATAIGRPSAAAWVGTVHVDDVAFDTAATGLIDAWVDVNASPIVSAGADQIATAGATVTLTGADSDTDGTISSRSWTQTGGTPTVTLSGSGNTRTFTMPIGAPTLTFTYSVTDNDGATSSDTVVVSGAAPTSGVTHWNSAEGGTEGVVATAGTSGGASGSALSGITYTASTASVEFDSARAAHGTKSYRMIAAAGSYASLVWNLATSRAALRAYIYLTAAPEADSQLMVLRSTGPALRLDISTARILRVNTLNGGVVHTFATPIPLDTWVRIEIFGVVGTAGAPNGQISAAWSVGDGYPTEELGLTTADIGIDAFTSAQVGKLSSTAWVADFNIDELAANTSATGLIGPWLASYNEPADAGEDQLNLEPYDTVTLIGTGVGSWSQVSGPAVVLGGAGATRTFDVPATTLGFTAVFAYGGSPVTVTGLPCTDYIGDRPTRLMTGRALGL